jgi:arginyl-tRNA--protein-N-Asp/Glu arginylyltransferase
VADRADRLLKLPHVYLGYWIAEQPEDGLQGQFRPHQVLIDGQWRSPPPVPGGRAAASAA